MDYKCGKCGSDNTQKLSVIYRQGLSTISTRSSGSGVDGDGLIWLDSETKGTSQTAASRASAPPERVSLKAMMITLGLLLLVAVGLEAAFGRFGNVLGLLLLTLGTVATVVGVIHHNFFVYTGLRRRWENAIHCNRCGEVTYPSE